MITVNRVGMQFHSRFVFRNLSLAVRKYDSIVLIGPSGHGKSLLLKMIAGLIVPDEGSVRVESQDIGMLFQKNALFDSFTVEENLLFPLKERLGVEGKKAKERAAYFLNEVGLRGSESLYPDEISGGMQKRLGIARALIVEPSVLLYDEPTAGLDPITSRTIATLILKLKEEFKSTLVSVTNDMERAYQLGNPIYFLAEGELILGGSPQATQESKHESLRQFVCGLKSGPLTRIMA